MLVLTRHIDQRVILTLPDGRRGAVVVVEAHGGKARLGFEFPADVQIHRENVQARVDRGEQPPAIVADKRAARARLRGGLEP